MQSTICKAINNKAHDTENGDQLQNRWRISKGKTNKGVPKPQIRVH